jgi:hypothetical protein
MGKHDMTYNGYKGMTDMQKEMFSRVKEVILEYTDKWPTAIMDLLHREIYEESVGRSYRTNKDK